MITEAIWTQRRHIKGSSRAAIKQFIIDTYPINQSRLKSYITSNLSKMLEDTEEGYPCLIRVNNMNYKLNPEWRKEWTKTNGKKHPIRRRRRRQSRDHPKRPRNAYVYFSKDVRPKRKDDNPDKSFIELTTLIADEWNELTGKQRKKYEDMAKKDRKRYQNEMDKYEAKRSSSSSDSDSDSESRSRKRRTRRRSSRRYSDSSDSKSHSKKKRRAKSSESESEEKKDKKKKSIGSSDVKKN